MNVRAYNLEQLFRQALGRHPLDCNYYSELGFLGFCSGCQPGDIGQCDKCGILLPCCQITTDHEENFCSDCSTAPGFSIDLRTGEIEHKGQAIAATSEMGGDR